MEQKENYWFKAKRYGYGWTPSSKEGWLITIIYIGVIIFSATRLIENDVPDLSFFKFFFVITILFILIAWRTGEKPKWRWGKRK